MKFIIHLILLVVGVHFLSMFFGPKWAWLVPILYGTLLSYSRASAILLGFLSLFIVWAAYTLYLNIENQSLLANKIGILLGGLPGSALPWVSAIVGAIGGSLSSWLGYEIGKWFR